MEDSASPAQGQQVISACAFIHAEFNAVKKVFLPKRADTKKFLPGVYELPGGHIDFGEDIVDGLRREIEEELHMRVNVGDPFAAYTYHNAVKGSHSVEVIYFAQFVGPIEEVRLNPKDHSTYAWLSKEEVLARRSEIVLDQKTEQVLHSQADDPEYLTILKGFELLEGKPLKVS